MEGGNKMNDRYDDINHHPDMMYELRMWEDIKDEMDYPEEDNNNGLIYGIYWLDDNDEVCDVEWLATEAERHNEVKETNKQLEAK